MAHEEAPEELVQFVVFWLGDTEFGVPVDQVRRVERLTPATRVPHAPGFLTGVANIQGDIVPVVDLKRCFDLAPTPYADKARIVVVTLEEQLVGMMVDAVREILWLPVGQVDSSADMAIGIHRTYLTGVGRLQDRLIVLLDLDQVLAVRRVDELAQDAS